MHYVSNHIPNSGSKSAPLAKPFCTKVLSFVVITGAAACILLPLLTVIYLLVGSLILRYWLSFWMNKHINGYTGDCLGAAQQLQELLIYLIILSNIQVIL